MQILLKFIVQPELLQSTISCWAKAMLFSLFYYKGGRLNAVKMVFLVTDGQSNIGRSLTVPKAQALKKARVKIFVVAVGSYIHGIDEMVRVASYPPKDHVFRVSSLRGFLEIINLIIQKVSPNKYAIVKGQSTRPCHRG